MVSVQDAYSDDVHRLEGLLVLRLEDRFLLLLLHDLLSQLLHSVIEIVHRLAISTSFNSRFLLSVVAPLML